MAENQRTSSTGLSVKNGGNTKLTGRLYWSWARIASLRCLSYFTEDNYAYHLRYDLYKTSGDVYEGDLLKIEGK